MQIIYIHGGTTHSTQKKYLEYLKNKTVYLDELEIWPSKLEQQLPQHKIIKPRMPLKENAYYEHWKIIFEKYLKITKKEIILIGFSLGAIFLARYLSENKTNKDIKGVFLVAPPFDDSNSNEELTNGFKLPKKLELLDQINNLNFFFSKTDQIVKITHKEKYEKKLKNAKFHVFEDKNGHFLTPNFKELIKLIKSI